MKLVTVDWVIVLATILVCFVPALFFGKRAGKNTSEFFASGRSVPLWLAGLSMVATTFSSDTPNWVTQQVRQYGVAGNWQWWAMVLTGVATVFFFARLWRRSGVMTDLEFYELRYSGRAASLVRGFRAVYLGLFFNCFIMGMVTLAACKIANVLFGLPPWQTIVICGLLNVVFAAHSGLWGVLVIDMVQFFIKMTAVIAAAYFSLKQVARQSGAGESAVAGLQTLVGTLGTQQVNFAAGSQPVLSPIDGRGQPLLDMMPNFAMTDLALMIFIVPIAIGWWANWYPGAEPGGGSYIAQRMLASKSERDAVGAVLFFNVAHYVLRPWPWILVALASLIVYPQLSDIQQSFPNLDPALLGHDIAYPAMLKFLPMGFIGLMVGGLIAANSSTILTHLNWGASYLVHDFYRRFVKSDAPERHYVTVARLVTVGLFVCSALSVYLLDTAKDAFDIILQVGAGTGLLYLVRWFWWRVNAWSEIVAMVSSFVVSIALLVLGRNGVTFSTHAALLITINVTTICWVLTAFFGPQTDRAVLINFYRKVRPFGPGWAQIRREAGVTGAATGENIPLALLGWISGCTAIWSALFTVGNFLYGRHTQAFLLLLVFAVSGSALVFVTKRLWVGEDKAVAIG